MVARTFVCITTVMLLSGCTMASGTFCQIAKPHRLSAVVVDAMTQAEVAVELSHNETGRKLCGWKPQG